MIYLLLSDVLFVLPSGATQSIVSIAPLSWNLMTILLPQRPPKETKSC